jgi:glycosyltransferase involved in cell wall biosynthesis
MSKKIFLYMAYTMHNAYRSMVANPPEGFEIIPSSYMAYNNEAGTQSLPSGFGKFMLAVRPSISQFYNEAHILFNSPKCRKFFSNEFDLVHSAQSLLDTNLPYVLDFEHAAVLCGYNQYGLESKGFADALKKHLLKKNLKKLLPWSIAAKESLLNFVKSDALEEKTEVVYKAVLPPKNAEKKKHDGVNFLFVGYYFYEKGGMDALLAFDRVSGRYECKFTIVSPVPDEVKQRFSKNKKIVFLGPQPYEKVCELYRETDVFLFPTHFDTYGFVIPEAFSYGIPVISVDHFSIPELVEDGKTGLLAKNYYSTFRDDRGYAHPKMHIHEQHRADGAKNPPEWFISELSEKIVMLIEDASLRQRLSANAKKEALEGKFSMSSWKQKMSRIYSEAIE